MVTAGEIGRTRSKPTPVGVRVGILTQVSCSKSFGVPFPFHRAWGAPYPDFLRSLVGPANLVRLSLKKGAHATLSGAACRKFGVSRWFFARCGIPQNLDASPTSEHLCRLDESLTIQ